MNKIIDAWGVFKDGDNLPRLVRRSVAFAVAEAAIRGTDFKAKPIRILTDPNLIVVDPGASPETLTTTYENDSKGERI